MGTFVMLDQPGGDVYVAWCTITDGPCTYGTRAEIHAHLMAEHNRDPGSAERQLDRAAQLGSSSPLAGYWTDTELLCRGSEEEGWLPRKDLVAYAQAVCRDDGFKDTKTADALLKPLDDDD